jgi:hypothetical protein
LFWHGDTGSGSGLHVAREMSVEGGELYLSNAYLDGHKVTNEDEVLQAPNHDVFPA